VIVSSIGAEEVSPTEAKSFIAAQSYRLTNFSLGASGPFISILGDPIRQRQAVAAAAKPRQNGVALRR